MKFLSRAALVLTAAFFLCPAAAAQQAGDWPTYLHDADRTGVSSVDLKCPLSVQWVYKARLAPQPAWPPPAKVDAFHGMRKLEPRVIYDRAFHVVGAGDSVYFASSADDKVYCLDAKTGREKWAFYAEGPVRLAPTITDGPSTPSTGSGQAGSGQAKVLFGSDDGCVYCLQAADGTLLWKVRPAPEDRRIPGNGRIISTWPVRTGVLVVDGKGYCCGGLFGTEGVYFAAIDIASGKVESVQKIGQSTQGYLECRGEKLFAPTGRAKAGAWLGPLTRRGAAAPQVSKQIQAQYPYATIASAALRFCGGDDEVAAFSAADAQKVWTVKVEGRAYSLAIVGQRLLVSTDKGMIYCLAPGVAGPNASITPGNPKPIACPDAALRGKYALAAEQILQVAKRPKGYCLVLNADKGYLAAELAARSELKIVCLEPDAAKAAALRKALDEAGLYGRVVVHQGAADKLPYGDWLFNIVVDDAAAVGKPLGGSPEEALRVTAPCGGITVLGLATGRIERRGELKGAGAWRHFYADPGNSACSGDTLVRGQPAVQWFGLPGPREMIDRHNRGMAPLSADGRLFVPGWDYVAAVDAYNGAVLWERELPGSARAIAGKNCGGMALADDALYVAAKDVCQAFDLDGGKVLRTFAALGARGDWGYVACVGDALFGSTTRPGASARTISQHSWEEGYSPMRPVVCSDAVFAYDRRTGRRTWVHAPAGRVIANPTIAIGDGRIYFIESASAEAVKAPNGRARIPTLFAGGADLVALDAVSGREAWRRKVTPPFQHALYLSFADGKLLLSGCRTAGKGILYDLLTFDAAQGRPGWSVAYTAPSGATGGSHGEITHHPVIANKTVYLWSAAYDLAGGQQRAGWNWNRGGHGCGEQSASATALFNRGSTSEMTELQGGVLVKLTAESRPGCWINIIPAGGLVLIPEGSSGCSCDYAIQSSIALRPVKG